MPSIAPRRNEIITLGGEMTSRFAEYLESLTSIVNETTDNVATGGATVDAIQTSVAEVAELNKRMNEPSGIVSVGQGERKVFGS